MVRESRKEDIKEILQLYLHLHEESIPEQSDFLLRTWEQIMQDENHHLIVNEVEGKIVSSCVCVIIPNLTRNVRPYAFVENVVTHRDYTGQGLATQCLDFAKQIAQSNNCYKMMLLTGSKEEKTLDFYRNAGYNSTDKTAFIQWLPLPDPVDEPGKKSLVIRKYRQTDCEKLADLFYDTVHSVNAKDYTKEQLSAWTGCIDLQKWNRQMLEHCSLVAVVGNTIAGFGDMDKTGYLDRLYVHKDYQRKGIATAICNGLERTVQGKITTHASITAKPFFEKRGYVVVREQCVERQGISLTNYVMEKCQ